MAGRSLSTGRRLGVTAVELMPQLRHLPQRLYHARSRENTSCRQAVERGRPWGMGDAYPVEARSLVVLTEPIGDSESERVQ